MRTPVADQPPCRLYRFWDDNGDLLYVGETARQAWQRLMEHLESKRWVGEIARWERDPRVFDGKQAVLDAERVAIETERPRFNERGNERNPDRVDPNTMRYPGGGLYRPDLYHQPGRVAVEVKPARTVRRSAAVPAARPRRSYRWLASRPAGYVYLWLVLAAGGCWAAVGAVAATVVDGAKFGAVAASVLFVFALGRRKPKRRRSRRRR